MKMKIIFATAFLVLINTASAGDTIVRCDGCSAYNAPTRAEHYYGSVMIFNPTTPAPSAWMFDVEYRTVGPNCDVERPGSAPTGSAALSTNDSCQRVRVALPIEPTPLAENLVNQYRTAFDSTNGTMKAAIELSFDNLGVPLALIPWTINAGGPNQGYTFVSAADIVNNINVRDWVTSNATTAASSMQSFINSPVGAFMNSLSNAVGVVFLGGDSSGITLKINCLDGSFVTLMITQDMILLNSPATIENARDAEGRTVMTRQNMADFSGYSQNYGNPRDETTFLNNAEILGVSITSTASASGRVTVCSLNGSNLLECWTQVAQ